MEKQITSKNTKNEILDAYQELLDKMQAVKSENPKQEAEKQKNEKLVEKASANNPDNIGKQISQLKQEIGQYLGKMESQLTAESQKLNEIRQAIQIENQNLEDIYGIKANTDSLAALIEAQKLKKMEFDQEMALKNEKAKENDEERKRNLKREEDEYQYNIKISRKKDQDAYDEKKIKLDKELTEKKLQFDKEIKEREDFIASKEATLAELQKEVESFPSKLDKAVKEATSNLQNELTKQFEYESKIASKDTEAELKLKDQEIANLKAKLTDQANQIIELSKKANEASAQVQDIAVKAIESSSKQSFVLRDKERAD